MGLGFLVVPVDAWTYVTGGGSHISSSSVTSLVFDDEFIRLRLASDQEPRDDILVRKIYGFSVDVPDAYGIPETVELELIRDEEVEFVGE